MAKRKAAKRKALKKVPKRKAILPMDRLRGILSGQSTDDLVQIIVELAGSNPGALRKVQQRFKVEDSIQSFSGTRHRSASFCGSRSFLQTTLETTNVHPAKLHQSQCIPH